MSTAISVNNKGYYGQGWHHGPNSKLNPGNTPINDSEVPHGMRAVRSRGCHGEGFVGLHGTITYAPEDMDSDEEGNDNRMPVKAPIAPAAAHHNVQQVAQQPGGKHRKTKNKTVKRAKSWFSWFLR